MTHILIVHPLQLVVSMLARALSRDGAFESADFVTSAADAQATLAITPYQMVLLSASLPDGEALTLTVALTADYPDLKVIVIGDELPAETIVTYMAAGAAAYVAKGSTLQTLMDIVQREQPSTLPSPCSPRQPVIRQRPLQ